MRTRWERFHLVYLFLSVSEESKWGDSRDMGVSPLYVAGPPAPGWRRVLGRFMGVIRA